MASQELLFFRIEMLIRWMAEQYDGIRAWWDGNSKLYVRSSDPTSFKEIVVPPSFVERWPPIMMEGELW